MAMKRNVAEAKNDFDNAVSAAGAKTQKASNGIPTKPAAKPDAKPAAKSAAKKVPVEKAAEVTIEVTQDTNMPAERKNNAVTTEQHDMVNIFSDLENQFITDYGMLPRIKASNGNCMDGDDKILGAEIEIQVLSWNRQYVSSPCDNDAPSELVKYSINREVFSDGTGSLDGYITDLKAAGWVDACVKEYFDVVAVLVKSEKDSDHIGEMVQLQLSPTSVKAFNGFRLQTAFKIARGLLPASSLETIAVSAEVVSAKGNTWTKFSFRPVIK